MKYLPLLTIVLLCACTQKPGAEPDCKKDPPFYLQGTHYDCEKQESRESP